jgi:LPS sulfotransferase NodH
LPAVDTSKLNAEQMTAWTDAKDRFRQVAASVHGARVLLNQLSERLQRQRVALHPEDAANALKMQGFLEDAADLIREGNFESAVDALRRADYVRAKLKSVTGQ